MSASDTEIDRALEHDPAGAYAAMDAPTRERYRQSCRKLAVWSKQDPVTVAREVVRLSEEHDADDLRGRHVGAQLLAEGRPRLEACLGCRAPGPVRLTRFARRHAATAYVGSMVLFTALALVGVERLLAARGFDLFHRVLLAAVLALPMLDLMNEGIDWVTWRLVADPTPLPKLDPEQVLGRGTRTLVATPLLVTCAEDVEAQLRKLVATLHHPLNRPRLDMNGRRVTAGYSMIQPGLEDG